MENKSGRKKSRDKWQQRGLFALVSNRPQIPLPGIGSQPPPDPGEEEPFPEEDE